MNRPRSYLTKGKSQTSNLITYEREEGKRSQKIIFAFVALFASVSILVGIGYAYFSDTLTGTGTAQAGSLNITGDITCKQIGQQTANSTTTTETNLPDCESTNLNPGDEIVPSSNNIVNNGNKSAWIRTGFVLTQADAAMLPYLWICTGTTTQQQLVALSQTAWQNGQSLAEAEAATPGTVPADCHQATQSDIDNKTIFASTPSATLTDNVISGTGTSAENDGTYTNPAKFPTLYLDAAATNTAQAKTTSFCTVVQALQYRNNNDAYPTVGQWQTVATAGEFCPAPVEPLPPVMVALDFGPTAGGDSTTVFGTGFTAAGGSALTVYIDGTPCVSTTYVSDTVLNCVTPAGSAGAKTVQVRDASNTPLYEQTSGFTYMASSGNIQAFSASACASMPLYGGAVLTDARDGNLYRVKKMPDGKCWMVDNLAYVGGGSNTYGDTVNTRTTTADCNSVAPNAPQNCLIEFTGVGFDNALTGGTGTNTSGMGDSGWTNAAGNEYKLFVNNNRWAGGPGTSAGANTPTTGQVRAYGGTGCGLFATNSDAMTSACATRSGGLNQANPPGQILYGFCTAIGLDATTTPTCIEATSIGYGTGYVEQTVGGPQAGIIGKAGGIGGESKGNTSAANQAGVNSATVGTICPAGWRLPVGRVGASDTAANNAYNEWNVLNESLFAGTNTVSTTINTGATRYGYWQPAGILPNGGAGTGAAFGTVSAGYFNPTYGLHNQSVQARWWSSSLYDSTIASVASVSNSVIYPGTYYNYKDYGVAVRCTLP